MDRGECFIFLFSFCFFVQVWALRDIYFYQGLKLVAQSSTPLDTASDYNSYNCQNSDFRNLVFNVNRVAPGFVTPSACSDVDKKQIVSIKRIIYRREDLLQVKDHIVLPLTSPVSPAERDMPSLCCRLYELGIHSQQTPCSPRPYKKLKRRPYRAGRGSRCRKTPTYLAGQNEAAIGRVGVEGESAPGATLFLSGRRPRLQTERDTSNLVSVSLRPSSDSDCPLPISDSLPCNSLFPPTPSALSDEFTYHTNRASSANLHNLIQVPLLRPDLPNQLCVCLFNARSVGVARKRTAIADFMSDRDVDIMVLTETWLKESGDESKIKDLTPPSYKFFSFPRHVTASGKRGGGIAVIMKESLAPNASFNTTLPFAHTSFEVVECTLTVRGQQLRLFCVYRPPPSSKNKLTHNIFFDELPDFLDYSFMCAGSLLAVGDFNIHYEDQRDSKARTFRELLQTFNLSQAVVEPTFPSSGHTLDLVIFRDTDCLLHSAKITPELMSDHYCVVSHLTVQKQKSEPKIKYVRAIRQIDHAAFSHDIDNINSQELSLSDLNSALREVFDKHAPLHQRKIKLSPSAPWYSPVSQELTQLKRERRQAERRWVQSRLTVDKQIYDSAKQKVVDFVHAAKTKFYSSKVANATSSKELFKTCSNMLGKTTDSALPSTHSLSQLPGLFSDYFNQKILTIRNGFSSPADNSDESVAFTGIPLCRFPPVSETVVRKLITESAKASCDLDPLPTPLLYEHLDSLLPTITRVLNDSLSSGSVPPDFKTALIKPLLKKSSLNPNILKNYRPISNLPFLSKILEKIVLQNLFDHLTSNNLLNPHQSAYRPRHSTETAILRILNDILNSLDHNEVSVLLLLDLSAAFDTIDHEILLARLEHTFGIRDIALNWFISYLTNRKQFVLVDSHRSNETSLAFGVPQGSVLGPVLFILYTTPLSDVIRRHSVSHEMFADDTQLLSSSHVDDYPNLVSSLHKCSSDVDAWMSSNRLKLNCEKTEAIRFSWNALPNLPPSISVGCSSIEFSDCVRDLGVVLDSDLSMKQHIKKSLPGLLFRA